MFCVQPCAETVVIVRFHSLRNKRNKKSKSNQFYKSKLGIFTFQNKTNELYFADYNELDKIEEK